MSELSTRHYDITIRGLPTVAPRRCCAVDQGQDQDQGSTISRRWKVLRDVLQPRLKARGVPFEYTIEVTSRCNLTCPMCPREIAPQLGERDMDIDTFRRVLERIRHAASFIWLAGLGEPMMNKHFFEMIELCQQAGIVTGASTNGTFLTPKAQQRLLDSGLDLLIISFDGADKESYEKVRVGADFDQ
ncbi:MAG: radical SAM protein, partial [Planctomycetes bacterium]|nr:radical SAM protein [Planctomycetota bacterium]